MQSINFTVPAGGSVLIPCPGNGIWFESGTSSTSDTYIVVRPDKGGAECVLKPGQNFQDRSNPATQWTITCHDPAASISGRLIIGNGDFSDDNTQNLVTIAASNVPNSAALPVQKQALSTITQFAPVTINTGAAQALVSDPTQRMLRIRNTHTTANLYLGGATVTTANAAIVIPAGGMWIEDEGAGGAWYATSDTNGCAVAIQGLKL